MGASRSTKVRISMMRSRTTSIKGPIKGPIQGPIQGSIQGEGDDAQPHDLSRGVKGHEDRGPIDVVRHEERRTRESIAHLEEALADLVAAAGGDARLV
jgi:hypothetical protein